MPNLPNGFIKAIQEAMMDAHGDVEFTDSPDIKEGLSRMAWSVSRVLARCDDQFNCQLFLRECNLE